MWEAMWTHVGGGVDPCGRGAWTHLVVAEHGHSPVGSVVRENLGWDTVRR